jgi:regulator of protease activity HflC (stomatin/prohibitin superfamily)
MLFFGVSIFLGIVLFFFAYFLLKSVYLVKQAEAIVVERLGRYSRVLTPGLHIVLPFLEGTRKSVWTFVQDSENGRHYRYTRTVSRIDLREAVYDFPRQNVISKDNVTMEINALLYYQITDPIAAVYEVNNLPQAIEKLTQTTLRNIIGSMDLDEILVSRDQINEHLRVILDEATDKWGVKVNRVELQEVNPPADIRQAMEKQMRAERERRAVILEAEGSKRAAILESEGVQESKVLRAKGEAEAQIELARGQAESRLQIAKAEAEAIQMVQLVVKSGDPLPYLIAMKYLEALPAMMKDKDGKMIVVPYEASSMIGSLASIKNIFQNVK